MKKYKIGIYSPYIDILGGGERYILSIAEYLSRKHEVDLFIRTASDIKNKVKTILNISLEEVHIVNSKLINNQNILKKIKSLNIYDIFFYMTDGSLFFSPAKKNFLIIQSPIHIPNVSLLFRLKLSNWKIICYSNFMKSIIMERLNKDAYILSPCIDIGQFDKKHEEKRNIILSVGRFFQYPHSKKHEVLIEMFKNNYEKYFKGWKLIIVGGLTEEGGESVFQNLKNQSKGFPIEILVNIPFAQLVKLYKMAKIYMHAAGFAEDIQKHPERVEHFGITTLEAMAAGTIPLVFAAGGQKDIVTDGQNGYLWSTEKELIDKLHRLISEEKLIMHIAENASRFVQNFSCQVFYERLEKLIS